VGISETQLIEWSAQGSTALAASALASIREALGDGRLDSEGRSFDVFLQGSYRNGTNTSNDRPADVVIQLRDGHFSNNYRLSDEDLAAHDDDHPPQEYRWKDFRTDVIEDLGRTFKLTEGPQSLWLHPGPIHLPAQVVVALTHRSYLRYRSEQDQEYHEGIVYWTDHGLQVVNYPRQHHEAIRDKDGRHRTDGDFTALVRVLKNARDAIGGELPEGTAPSCFVESFACSIPDTELRGGLRMGIEATLNHLRLDEHTTVMCANGIQTLFGPSTMQWDRVDAHRFYDGLVSLTRR
jgi:hypothetical protein